MIGECFLISKLLSVITASIQSGFQLTVESNFAIALALHCCTLCHFLDQSEVKPKPIVTYLHALSCSWLQLPVLSTSSDWFIGLSESVVIGESILFLF